MSESRRKCPVCGYHDRQMLFPRPLGYIFTCFGCGFEVRLQIRDIADITTQVLKKAAA